MYLIIKKRLRKGLSSKMYAIKVKKFLSRRYFYFKVGIILFIQKLTGQKEYQINTISQIYPNKRFQKVILKLNYKLFG
jgi:hypothetical protein